MNLRNYLCKEVGCETQAYAKHLCNAHYLRARKGSDMAAPVRLHVKGRLCAECAAPVGERGAKGLCAKHYKKLIRRELKAHWVAVKGGSCAACRKVYPLAAFDFHHTGGKDHSIAKLLCSAAKEALTKEMDKCVLLCANCHRIEHNE